MLARAARHAAKDRLALVSAQGERWSYGDLLDRSGAVARGLREVGVADASSTVAFLTPESPAYVAAQWGIWRAGGVAVPLCTKHPADELAYVLSDSGARTVVGHSDFEAKIRPLAEEAGLMYLPYEELAATGSSGDDDLSDLEVAADRPAHVLYTSGTTGRPKGVLHTHGSLDAQITDLTTSWEWSANDRILHFLPLHHAHGIVNKLCCALHAGAAVEFSGGFDAARVWERLMVQGDAANGAPRRSWRKRSDEAPITLLMAVPTVYAKLIEEFDHRLGGSEQARARRGAEALRLMVSGSAALPISMLRRWKEITGHTLLERYGMTEFGMALSNPLAMDARRAGYVGAPLPSVEARIVRAPEEGEGPEEVVCGAGEAGELRVRGANLFSEYLNKPDATAAEFDAEGWFKTGDVAAFDVFGDASGDASGAASGAAGASADEGERCYKILGRASVDIIKSGGYKISALDVERQLLEHPNIVEAVVVGVENETYGQRVGCFVRTRGTKPDGSAGRPLDAATLNAWMKSHLAPYAVPSVDITRFVDDIPKNQMGKVNKKALAPLLLEAKVEEA